MRFLSPKPHHRKYFLQVIGFVGLVLFTAVTVAIGNSVYQYASVLQEEELQKQEETYAIFEEEEVAKQQPQEWNELLSSLLTFIR